jgi:hypothetical protein
MKISIQHQTGLRNLPRAATISGAPPPVRFQVPDKHGGRFSLDPRFPAAVKRAKARAPSERGERGFNMVEIALALAVIAFALVAIIGVLPFGMQVQKETREKTIINEEAQYFLSAIKNPAVGLLDLTNFVQEIYTNIPPPLQLGAGYTEGWQIIGLLSRPGRTRAIVRAVTGSAIDRGSSGAEFAFRYRMTVEIEPATNTMNPGRLQDPDLLGVLTNHLWDVRLQFQWPITPAGVGGEEAVYRSLVTARLVNEPTNSGYFFFRP